MDIARETVSRWENEKEPMGPRAERLLRLMVLREKPVEEYPNDNLARVAHPDAPPLHLDIKADKSGWHIQGGSGPMQSASRVVELPADIANFAFPASLDRRLQFLLDKQDRGDVLSEEERAEAEGLVELSSFLSLLKFLARPGSQIGYPVRIMRFTPLAKAFIVLTMVAVGGSIEYFHPQWWRPSPKSNPPGESAAAPGRIIIGVNDFGGAYPLLLANDGALPGPGSAFKKAGLDVEIRLIRGSKERLKAFDDGQVQVMLLTLDYLANLVPLYKQKGIDLQSFLLVDWSRGNIGIIAKPQFQSIEDLRHARIATTRNTPTHYLLLSLLDRSNLKPPEIEEVKTHLVFATKTPEAASLFFRGEVDAAALWEPHLSQALAGQKGHSLVTTSTATNLIADVLFAKTDFLQAHKEELPVLLTGFFAAVQRLVDDPDARERTIQLAATAFEQKPEEIHDTLLKVKPASFAAPRDFFGLATEDCAYDRLYLDASRFWKKEGLFPGDAPPPAGTKYLLALDRLAPKYKADRVVEDFTFTAAPRKQDGPSLLTKSVSIYFDTGSSTIDPNARGLLDGFAQTLSVFQNAYVRIEGNTDNAGRRAANVALSEKRSAAVVDYLIERHRFERARLVAVGNGPDQPVADNHTQEGRALNRRTEFKIIKNAAPGEAVVTPMAQEIIAAVQRHKGELSACYNEALAKHPQLAGRVVLRLTVGADGAVERSRVAASTLYAAGVERCLLRAAEKWRLPPPPGRQPLTVDYPVVMGR